MITKATARYKSKFMILRSGKSRLWPQKNVPTQTQQRLHIKKPHQSRLYLVPGAGLEPVRPCGHYLLKLISKLNIIKIHPISKKLMYHKSHTCKILMDHSKILVIFIILVILALLMLWWVDGTAESLSSVEKLNLNEN